MEAGWERRRSTSNRVGETTEHGLPKVIMVSGNAEGSKEEDSQTLVNNSIISNACIKRPTCTVRTIVAFPLLRSALCIPISIPFDLLPSLPALPPPFAYLPLPLSFSSPFNIASPLLVYHPPTRGGREEQPGQSYRVDSRGGD